MKASPTGASNVDFEAHRHVRPAPQRPAQQAASGAGADGMAHAPAGACNKQGLLP